LPKINRHLAPRFEMAIPASVEVARFRDKEIA
jgi:hypothetical protein